MTVERIRNLEQERDTLRKALRRIATESYEEYARSIARAALEKKR